MTDDGDLETAILRGGPLDGTVMPVRRDQATVEASVTSATVSLVSVDTAIPVGQDSRGSAEDVVYSRSGTVDAAGRPIFHRTGPANA